MTSIGFSEKDDATRCPCATNDNATSTTTATVIAVGPPPIDEVNELEKAIQRICLRLRQHVEDSARNESEKLVKLRVTCSVTLEYKINATVKRPDRLGGTQPRTDCSKAVTRLKSQFVPDNVTGGRRWDDGKNKQRQNGNNDSLRTQFENIEKNVGKSFQPES